VTQAELTKDWLEQIDWNSRRAAAFVEQRGNQRAAISFMGYPSDCHSFVTAQLACSASKRATLAYDHCHHCR
jgi:hypothetical protein